MIFKFDTEYNLKTLTAMVKTIRKTTRKLRTVLLWICTIIVFIVALLFSVPLGILEVEADFSIIIMWIAVVFLVFVMIFEDRIGGFFIRKSLNPSLKTVKTTFMSEGYTAETEMGVSDFKYNTIRMIVETDDYFVFIFEKKHAQIIKKEGIFVGTLEDFYTFITKVTGKKIKKI